MVTKETEEDCTAESSSNVAGTKEEYLMRSTLIVQRKVGKERTVTQQLYCFKLEQILVQFHESRTTVRTVS